MESRMTFEGMPTRKPTVDPKAAEVRRHFDASAAEFDAIYTGRKSTVGRWLDRTFRKDMFERLELTLREIKRMDGVSVLDLGCGSGIFSVALAHEGARAVIGVDFSQPMIELARRRAATAGLSSRCDFVVGDFMLLDFPERFDCCIAVGVFDYLAEPRAFVERMRGVTKRKIIATFPCKWTYRAPIRKMRLTVRGCPVHFYSAADVRRLFDALGASRLTIRRIGHIFLVVADFEDRETAPRIHLVAVEARDQRHGSH
jgi:ubiquinone/menaquinone biosynthesis C-methylase UbiE